MAIVGSDITDHASIDTSQKVALFQLLWAIATTLFLWLFTKYVDKIKFKGIGFSEEGIFGESAFGVLAGAVAVFIGLLFLVSTDQIDIIGINYDSVELLYFVFICILISFTEEILFRGYILRNLTVSFNRYVALLISSLIFSLLHFPNPGNGSIPLVSIFLSGVLMGLPYIFNKRLWFPLGIHFGWNFFQGIFGFRISGNDIYRLIDLDLKGNDYLTGGEFGFEGSIYSILLQLILIIFVFAYFRKQINN